MLSAFLPYLFLVVGVFAVLAVAGERMADRGHVRADLVRAAGQKLDLQQAEIAPRLEHRVFGADAPALVRLAARDVDAVLALVFLEIAGQRVAFLFRHAADDAQVELVHLAVLDLLVHDAQRFRVFRGHHDATGVAVDAVDQRRRKRIFLLGVVFAAVVEVVLHAGDQRIEVVVFVRVHDQARFLVEDHDVLVLVKHADFGRGLQEVVRLRRLREEFVLQVHRQHVAGLQACGDLAALSVQLDVLFADRLVEHGLRQVRVGFGQKFVDALVSVVRHDGNLFQAAFPFLCVRPSVKKNGGRETTMPIAMAIAIAILIVSMPVASAAALSFMKIW